ncbi:DNA recombination protein RmuC [soil metagenome]
MDFLYLAIGLVLGAVVIFFYSKSKKEAVIADTTELDNLRQQNQTLQNDLTRSQERACQLAIQYEEHKLQASSQQEQYKKEATTQLEQYKVELNTNRQQVLELSTQLTGRETDLTNLRQRLEEQKQEVEQLQQKFTTEFKNIANEILEDKSRRFTEQNKTNISEILNPLQEKIKEFERKVDDTHKASLVTSTELQSQLKTLHDLNKTMSKEAENLTKALKGDNKAQGGWGEMVLQTILELSGLTKDREYFMQNSFTLADGKRYQPDVIIRLPEGKSVIIDSKVSLLDYERCVSTDNEEERSSSLVAHVRSIRNHVKGLSDKSYQNIPELEGLDFVLMFIPIEPAFSIAMQKDSALYQEAWDKKILLTSPYTLMATLRTIANIWRQENQNKNAIEIARQSGALYDKFVGLSENLLKIGVRINDSKKEYDEAMKKLSEGDGNLIRKVEQLKVMGAKATKAINPALLDRAGVEKELPVGSEEVIV